MFKDKTIKKTYLAIVKGSVSKDEGRIETIIGRNPNDRKKMAVVEKNGKIAISNYKVLDRGLKHTLVQVDIETGRTHQIRVHMKHIGYPIEGDMVYGKGNDYAKRQMLHAYRLVFTHPITGENLDLIGKLPVDFKDSLKKLGLDKNEF